MSEVTKTPEELAAEQASANLAKAAAEKAAAEKAAKEAKAAAAKAEKEAAAAKRKADADAKKAAKVAEKAAAEAKKEADKKAKLDAAAAASAAKEAAKQPEQNGVRRPGPEGKCGQAWALMDSMSAAIQSPVAIGDLLVKSREAAMNDNMVRANYAAWKKFHGIAGRVARVPVAAPAATTGEAAQAAQ